MAVRTWVNDKLTLTNALLSALWVLLAVDIINQEGPVMSNHLEDIVVMFFLGCLLYFSRKLDQQHQLTVENQRRPPEPMKIDISPEAVQLMKPLMERYLFGKEGTRDSEAPREVPRSGHGEADEASPGSDGISGDGLLRQPSS